MFGAHGKSRIVDDNLKLRVRLNLLSDAAANANSGTSREAHLNYGLPCRCQHCLLLAGDCGHHLAAASRPQGRGGKFGKCRWRRRNCDARVADGFRRRDKFVQFGSRRRPGKFVWCW